MAGPYAGSGPPGECVKLKPNVSQNVSIVMEVPLMSIRSDYVHGYVEGSIWPAIGTAVSLITLAAFMTWLTA